MPTTVTAAFEQFLRDHVNLDPGVTVTARASRDWLQTQLAALAAQSEFPVRYPEIDMHYGSFARRTKIRELDDVDLIVGIAGLGTTYDEYGAEIRLTVPEGLHLRSLCHDGTRVLNSRKVINTFVRQLSKVPQYERADIKRNEAAATLKLKSYPWSFDIVPAFFTEREFDGRNFYIIPDGSGHWLKTDPRIDHERVRRINQASDGNVLNAIRIMKHWNARRTMPTAASYLIECIILDYYDAGLARASEYPDIEMIKLLPYLATRIVTDVADPKRIQGNLNDLGWAERRAISARASQDALKADAARTTEVRNDHRKAIEMWREVLGPDFPKYG